MLRGGVRKVFFSVEKKQKTFASLSRFYPKAHAAFFSKKNRFPDAGGHEHARVTATPLQGMH
jgi:hypothetical protein